MTVHSAKGSSSTPCSSPASRKGLFPHENSMNGSTASRRSGASCTSRSPARGASST
jgi:hypothetical protein